VVKHIINDYQPSDYQGLFELWQVTGLGDTKRGDNHEVIMKTLGMGGKLLIMKSETDNQIIGSSWITNDGRRLYLHHFGILPEFQGKGLAKHLMAETIRVAKELGFQMKLEVHTSNYKAIELYKKYGFKSLGDYAVYIIRDIEGVNL
jgi:[ribosomal protein S18]-alanine N-acetyltransferase